MLNLNGKNILIMLTLLFLAFELFAIFQFLPYWGAPTVGFSILLVSFSGIYAIPFLLVIPIAGLLFLFGLMKDKQWAFLVGVTFILLYSINLLFPSLISVSPIDGVFWNGFATNMYDTMFSGINFLWSLFQIACAITFGVLLLRHKKNLAN